MSAASLLSLALATLPAPALPAAPARGEITLVRDVVITRVEAGELEYDLRNRAMVLTGKTAIRASNGFLLECSMMRVTIHLTDGGGTRIVLEPLPSVR